MARVFISYSHQDEAWKDRVVRQLGVLAAEGLETWDDRRIDGGDDWYPEIEQAITGCDVALLLISANFLTSKFILGNEVPPLLQRRQEQGIRVIPVVLSPCQWARIPWLKTIQARPKDGKPLTGMSEHDAETALSDLVGEIVDLTEKQATNHPPGAPLPPDKIDLTHLPEGAPHFLGREHELAALDAAWRDAGRTAIVQIIAPGGVGKTALVKRWLDGMRIRGWEGARRVYGWSFYSQGTREDQQASEDLFLANALEWLGVEHDPALNPADKGRLLAEAVVVGRTLLLLDGVEPLQYPPGPLEGELHAPGLKALLTHLATAGQAGLCVISSRERLADLDEWERNEHRPNGGVPRLDLGNLSESDGARLLHDLGVKRAGAAQIAANDEELKQASREVKGHALTLSLLGRYLELAYEGDIRRRDQVDFQEADAEVDGGHAFRVMKAYETWFARAGQKGERELAALRLLGFFDRPASRASLRALRTAPAIPGLTRPLVTLKPELWRVTLKRLQACGLVYFDADAGSVDAHPLVRQYLAKTLSESMPEAWREGHRRLYEQLKASVPHRPEGLAGLQPLYQAVAHGCLAGLWQEACDEVYVDRILRGAGHDGYYSTRKLGALGADLGVVACFFVEPWRRLIPALSEADQAWLLNEAATRLRALGRLGEALEPMWASGEMDVERGEWEGAAISYGNLSELQLSVGRVGAAVADAESSVDYADCSGNAVWRMVSLSALADALLHHGEGETAAARFSEAETLQKERQPLYPLLYSVQGFQYCDLLLGGAERAAWGVVTGGGATDAGGDKLRLDCSAVMERAVRTLRWADKNNLSLLDIALDHLTVARCALYSALLNGSPPDAFEAARKEIDSAVAGLRAAGDQSRLPLGLLTRAWLRQCLDDEAGARADLDEVERIARRGNMRLHLADLHLTRARLFRDRDELAKARALIEECEYWRRLPELEDAERAMS